MRTTKLSPPLKKNKEIYKSDNTRMFIMIEVLFFYEDHLNFTPRLNTVTLF